MADRKGGQRGDGNGIPRADNTQKDPDRWKTGEEPMTGAQRSYLETLSDEAGEQFDPGQNLSKAEASKRIDELQAKTGRGSGSDEDSPNEGD